jgi:hypothetical protein
MKTLFFAAAIALTAAPALAQDHAAHHSEGPAAKPAGAAAYEPAATMHAHCTAQTSGNPPAADKHDHSAHTHHHDAGKAPSEAELKAMHARCAAAMAQHARPAAPSTK